MPIIELYAFCKIAEHPNPSGGGADKGDISSFHRADYVFSDEEVNMFLPVLMDLNVPCGDKYDLPDNKCGPLCPWYDPDVCDVIKYSRAEWDAGDIEKGIPPKAIKTRRYKIDRGLFLTSGEEIIVSKPIKTPQEKATIINIANTKKQIKTIIEDKKTVVSIR